MAGGKVRIEKVGDFLKGKKREMGQSEAGRLAGKSRSVSVEKIRRREGKATTHLTMGSIIRGLGEK